MKLATLAVAGTLVGGLGGTMTRLSEPDPDPSVPASIVQQLLGPHSPPELATIGEGLPSSPDLHSNVAPEHGAVFLHSALGLAMVEFIGFVRGVHVWFRGRNP